MAHQEIDSFVLKFRNLCRAGYTASLCMEAEDGKASITLKAKLGHVPPPFLSPHLHPHGPSHRVHRGPSYLRRQERRKAAKTAAAAAPSCNESQAEQAITINHIDETDATNQAEEAQIVTVEVSEKDIQEEEEPNKDFEKQETIQIAEKLTENFECPLCDFSSKWENGLNVHLARKHSKLNQLDGVSDTEDFDEKYNDSKHYWKTGWLGTVYQSFLSANAIIEETDMPEDEKKKEKAKILEARKTAFGQNFSYFPPWDK